MIQFLTHEDLQLLIKSIESLKPENNLIKDYIYPIALAFISAVIGGFVGYLGILQREHEEGEKAKINATNKLLLEATDCFHSLLALKRNYQGKLTDDPPQRLLCVPPILMHHRPSDPELSGLFYLARVASKFLKTTPQKIRSNFANIPSIRLLFGNYNTALEMWKTRSELVGPIFESIVSGNSVTGMAHVRIEDMVNTVGHAKIAQLIDLNEKILSITDDLLVDFMKLMTELPEICSPLISKRVMRKHGEIFRLEFNSEIHATISNRVPVNQEILDSILNH